MLVESLPKGAPWDVVARSVFWSRDVDLQAWRDGIISGHRSYLPESVTLMSTWHFVRFLGRSSFEKHWPEVRLKLMPFHRGRARLDVAWSVCVSGTFNMPPEAAQAVFPGRSRQVFDAIVHHQGASIYEVSHLANVPYRRTHAHVQSLVKKGLVKSFTDHSGARTKRRLYTMK